MTTKLKGYGNFIKEMTDLFVPFTEDFCYEKKFYDVQLPNGDIIEHCWPNAGHMNDMKSTDKHYLPGECSIRLSKTHPANNKPVMQHISAIRMKVLENIEEIYSRDSSSIKYIERLLGVKDIVGPDGKLRDDVKERFLFGKAFDDFTELEAVMDEEADKRTMSITPIREKIATRLHNISPDDSSDKIFLRRLQNEMLYENIINSRLIENLLIIIESLKITDLDTIIRLKDILIESNPENIKFFISIFGVLDEKMLFMLKTILKEGNPEILKQKLKDTTSWSEFLGDLSEG